MDVSTTRTTSQSSNYFKITPPLLNSSNAWATSAAELKDLYDCPYTGAVTIRTSLWQEFKQDASIHQYTFFSSQEGRSRSKIDTLSNAEGRGEILPDETSSLNTLGYSLISFIKYCELLTEMARLGQLSRNPAKPFIVSVTGDEMQVGGCLAHLIELQNDISQDNSGLELMMEVNLSCPNIPDKAPPAYDGPALSRYITFLAETKQLLGHTSKKDVKVGIKTPPYTYQGQFVTLIQCLDESTRLIGGCPISFITATNTLGGCLVINESGNAALGSANGTGIGGMAGDALHPLALGNVKMIRMLLNASSHEGIRNIAIVGIGGVKDSAGFERMKSVGAAAVGVGTALGREGISVFEKITNGGLL